MNIENRNRLFPSKTIPFSELGKNEEGPNKVMANSDNTTKWANYLVYLVRTHRIFIERGFSCKPNIHALNPCLIVLLLDERILFLSCNCLCGANWRFGTLDHAKQYRCIPSLTRRTVVRLNSIIVFGIFAYAQVVVFGMVDYPSCMS
jgi:hypothetical protein